MICFISALWASSFSVDKDLAKRVFWSHFKRGFFCQNSHTLEGVKKQWWDRDPLSPSHITALILAAEMKWFYWFVPVGWVWSLGDLWWNTKKRPWEEQNQFIAMASILGGWLLTAYTVMHPDWEKAVRKYWSGWRDQAEIGEAIIRYVNGRVWLINEI